MDISLLLCVQRCSPYFAATTVKEILEILRPQIYPPDSKFGDTIKMFQIFLPTNLPSDLHRQGFKFAYAFCVWNNYPFHWRLWPAEFFPILVRGLIRGQPEETVAYFMPTSCESIPKSIGTSIDDDEDLKLN
ncbi:unnamed protein product [Adineta ricciae]|uniref:Uncharacterized protein n=1 Tax=Adineta ricciae TaxID=249248 RepID=A0A815C369_ADIRI|nr:unnamed protein product [Adineta ricciae]